MYIVKSWVVNFKESNYNEKMMSMIHTVVNYISLSGCSCNMKLESIKQNLSICLLLWNSKCHYYNSVLILKVWWHENCRATTLWRMKHDFYNFCAFHTLLLQYTQGAFVSNWDLWWIFFKDAGVKLIELQKTSSTVWWRDSLPQ